MLWQFVRTKGVAAWLWMHLVTPAACSYVFKVLVEDLYAVVLLQDPLVFPWIGLELLSNCHALHWRLGLILKRHVDSSQLSLA